jgi:hypothetical protein
MARKQRWSPAGVHWVAWGALRLAVEVGVVCPDWCKRREAREAQRAGVFKSGMHNPAGLDPKEEICWAPVLANREEGRVYGRQSPGMWEWRWPSV